MINLAFLSPDILQVICQGRQPDHVTADRLVRMGMPPANWEEQWAWLQMNRDFPLELFTASKSA